MAKRYAKRTDANQQEIVDLFRALGCNVYDASRLGGGFPDLIVQRQNPRTGIYETWLVEVKDHRLPPSRRRLNALQSIFHAKWHCKIVTCQGDVLEMLGIEQ
jgi:hypothetical protein